MGKSSGGGGATSAEVRYPPYLEAVHTRILDAGGSDSPVLSVVAAFNSAQGQSPFGGYDVLEADDAFFDSGYGVASYPSLYDMFGKFMAGLDVHVLWNQIYEDTVHDSEIQAAVAAQAALLDDDIESKVLPRFNAGMRNINAVQSSAFEIGRAMIEDARVKSINKFQADIRLKAIDASVQIWARHLEWNKAVVGNYLEYAKTYFVLKESLDVHNAEFASKDLLWDLGLFDYVRAVMGAMSGTAAATGDGGKPTSKLAGVIGGGMSGAAMGAQIGGGPGAAVGGFLGVASALL